MGDNNSQGPAAFDLIDFAKKEEDLSSGPQKVVSSVLLETDDSKEVDLLEKEGGLIQVENTNVNL